MPRQFLVTTALEDTWPDAGPVLFLGEWCRRYSRKTRWELMDAEVLPYHWDNREKLFSDYEYLEKLYEQLLLELTAELNVIHNVEYGLPYWRILIGPWLQLFVHVLYDRWSSIEQVCALGLEFETVVAVSPIDDFIANDMYTFLIKTTEDKWNHFIYSIILQQFTDVFCTQKILQSPLSQVKNSSKKNSWKTRLFHAYEFLFCFFSKETDAFLLLTYLPYFEELKAQFFLGQIPIFRRPVSILNLFQNDLNQRHWTLKGVSQSDFEICVRALIPSQLPMAYLEGYAQVVSQTESLPWPKRPKLIWTSNAHISDEIFKSWTAKKKEAGVPLVIGQHGGVYGVSKLMPFEAHELAICNGYLSWGWLDSHTQKIYSVGQLKLKKPLGVNHYQQNQALLITMSEPRYSNFIRLSMMSSQWLDYFEEQCVFVETLPESIRRHLIVRMQPEEYGWEQVMRWNDRFDKLHLDDGSVKIEDAIKKSRICISTYNATSFLEAFTMNVPTVIYWSSKRSELRDAAIPYFEDLKRVGIFHETPESAAHHVAAIWDNMEAWWASNVVQEVLKRFTRKYCDLPDDLLKKVTSSLRTISELS